MLPPLVLSSSLGTTRRMWDPNVERLSERYDEESEPEPEEPEPEEPASFRADLSGTRILVRSPSSR